MQQAGQAPLTKRTRSLKAAAAQCHWKETLHFQLVALDQECSLKVKLYSRSSVRRKQCLGQVSCVFFLVVFFAILPFFSNPFLTYFSTSKEIFDEHIFHEKTFRELLEEAIFTFLLLHFYR